MFNKIMRWAYGHVVIRFNESGKMTRELCRDKARIMAIAEASRA